MPDHPTPPDDPLYQHYLSLVALTVRNNALLETILELLVRNQAKAESVHLNVIRSRVHQMLEENEAAALELLELRKPPAPPSDDQMN